MVVSKWFNCLKFYQDVTIFKQNFFYLKPVDLIGCVNLKVINILHAISTPVRCMIGSMIYTVCSWWDKVEHLGNHEV